MIKKLVFTVLLSGMVMIVKGGLNAPPYLLPDGAMTASKASLAPETYDDLVDFFFAWREFHAPKMIDGAPDYSVNAMDRRHRELADWQSRLYCRSVCR